MSEREEPQNEPPREPIKHKDSLASEGSNLENPEDERKREDARSIFVENVDYKSTKEDLELIFEDCGAIYRVTILKDNFTKQPKGLAYVCFEQEADAEIAVNLSGTRLRGRTIKIQKKRTNVQGMGKSAKASNLDIINHLIQYRGSSNYRGKFRGRGK